MKQDKKIVCVQLGPIKHFSIAAALLLFCATTTAFSRTAEQIAEKALAATVYLEIKDRNGSTLGFGSGFFVEENLIATSYHVIEGAASGTAKKVNNEYAKYVIEGTTGIDKTNDLVLLKVVVFPNDPQLSAIHKKLIPIEPLSLGNSDNIKIGATVYVAGNPKGLEGTFSSGIISRRRDNSRKERLQMTAPVSPGSSGGPVLNTKGEVIGISYMTIESGQNLNFAIPSNYLKALITQSAPVQPLAQRNQPISAETYFLRGNTMFALEIYKEAIVAYDKAIQLEPDNVESYYNRGSAKYNLGQYFDAITDFDTTIQLKPDSADAYNYRGIAKSSLGQYFDAIADFDTAIRLDPNFALAYHNRGVVKIQLGQYSAAITDCDTAIRLEHDLVKAYNARGHVKIQLEQYFAAITDFDTVIELDPNNASAYHNRGIAKIQLGQYSAAITDYDMAIRLEPDYASAYFQRGISKFFLKNYFAAIADYDMAIRLEPDYGSAYYRRGTVKVALGRILEAKRDFRIALKLAEEAGDMDAKTKIEIVLQLFE